MPPMGGNALSPRAAGGSGFPRGRMEGGPHALLGTVPLLLTGRAGLCLRAAATVQHWGLGVARPLRLSAGRAAAASGTDPGIPAAGGSDTPHFVTRAPDVADI